MKDMLTLYTKGHSDLEIARAHKISVGTVCRWRKLLGLPPQTKFLRISQAQKDEIVRLLTDQVPIATISIQTGVFAETIRKLANRRGIPYARAERRTTAKEVHGILGYGGYVELRVDVDGPYGNLVKHGGESRGYAGLHRMRAQDRLGRNLTDDDIVHHKDGDIYNNSLDNLELMTHAQHQRLHRETGLRRCKEAAPHIKQRRPASTRRASKTDENQLPE